MAFISCSRIILSNVFSILRSGECSTLAASKKLSESNLEEIANAFHIRCLGPMREFLRVNYDNKALLAELIYLEDAYRLAQSGEVDQVNEMTDLQLRLVAYSKNILPLEELYSRNSFQIRISLLVMFACRPALQFEQDPESIEENDESEEKIIFTKLDGVVMRF
ncbi:uncharacterized protein EKO05_0004731 [Ascochyta rabiei]|uniref:Uncharacterized protein n=1 Tax=Didymella rabiei TaxID=5454 RepID=A0A163KES7_DIDRA|nr:uncharacterized protein EKO05_0004731 [Ascochyta rabiei]KZM26950.1 hypothetical protein ST47_g1907 [Ascochyta rabiei]UPX14242.1 hypothetical protein EKO05_0004731 [Ascochyta rabiei]